MTYKTLQEVLRAAADWMDVCEAAGVEARCKIGGNSWPLNKSYFVNDPSVYEFPLGLIDGKEVWEGDTIYDSCGSPHKADRTMQFGTVTSAWLLTPPKPKTVMVELSEEDAKTYARLDVGYSKLATACRIALEQSK